MKKAKKISMRGDYAKIWIVNFFARALPCLFWWLFVLYAVIAGLTPAYNGSFTQMVLDAFCNVYYEDGVFIPLRIPLSILIFPLTILMFVLIGPIFTIGGFIDIIFLGTAENFSNWLVALFTPFFIWTFISAFLFANIKYIEPEDIGGSREVDRYHVHVQSNGDLEVNKETTTVGGTYYHERENFAIMILNALSDAVIGVILFFIISAVQCHRVKKNHLGELKRSADKDDTAKQPHDKSID